MHTYIHMKGALRAPRGGAPSPPLGKVIGACRMLSRGDYIQLITHAYQTTRMQQASEGGGVGDGGVSRAVPALCAQRRRL